jgi:hypothetical protein
MKNFIGMLFLQMGDYGWPCMVDRIGITMLGGIRGHFFMGPPFPKSLIRMYIETLFGRWSLSKDVGHIRPKDQEVFSS